MRLLVTTLATTVAAFLGGFAVGFEPPVAADVAATSSATLTRPWPKPWTVDVDPAIPTHIVDKLDDAFLAGFDVAGLHCGSVEVDLVDDPEDRSWATVRDVDACVIGLDREAIGAGDWFTDYSVYHEVAHLFSIGEPQAHGPMFRVVEEYLLGRVGITPVYFTVDAEYPEGFWLPDGSCYDTCR